MSLTRTALLLLLAGPASALRRHTKTNSSSRGYIVTMGDSYSSGTGIHKYIRDYHEGDKCCREFKTTPGGQLSQMEGKTHLMPACGGDELPQIREQFAGLQENYPEEAARDWQGSTMMLTIGGNDIRSNGGDSWPGILVNCIISFYTDCHKKDSNQVANFDELRGQLTEFYNTVARGASKATIRVWGYPKLLQRKWHCIPVPGVNSDATKWMDDMVDVLNGHIKRAVDAAKSQNPGVDFDFIDPTPFFSTGACSIMNPHVKAIVLSFENGLSPQSFHPSQRGYNAYYDSLANSLGRGLPPSNVWPGPPEPWFIERIFSGWDVSNTGKLSMSDVRAMAGEDASEEAIATLTRAFHESDVNQDGSLDVAEFEIFLPKVEESVETD